MICHPDCYCPVCAVAILDSVDPLLDPEVFSAVTEARIEANPDG